MRILHITATHLNNEGGIPIVLKNLVAEQNKINNVTSKVLAIKKNVNIIDTDDFVYISKMKDICKFILQYDADFVIFHSVYFIEYSWLSYFLKKKKIKYFIEPHGSFVDKAMEKSHYKKIFANATVLHRFIKNAFGFIFLSESEKKSSIFHSKNDIIISNGVECKKKFNLKEKKSKQFLLYYIGRYDIREKGIDILLDAIKILDTKNVNITLDLYGKGNKESEEYIDNKIKEYNTVIVNKNGPIYGEDKYNKLKNYDAMILPSRHEGFPMTVLEALSYSVPCIVTEETNVSDLILKSNIGKVIKLNAESIAKSIQQIIEDTYFVSDECRKKCHDTIIDNYTWDKVAKNSYNEINQFIKNKGM